MEEDSAEVGAVYCGLWDGYVRTITSMCVGIFFFGTCCVMSMPHSTHSVQRQMVWRIFNIFLLASQMVVELIFRKGKKLVFWSIGAGRAAASLCVESKCWVG